MMTRAVLNDAPSFYGIDYPCIDVNQCGICDRWLFYICALIF